MCMEYLRILLKWSFYLLSAFYPLYILYELHNKNWLLLLSEVFDIYLTLCSLSRDIQTIKTLPNRKYEEKKLIDWPCSSGWPGGRTPALPCRAFAPPILPRTPPESAACAASNPAVGYLSARSAIATAASLSRVAPPAASFRYSRARHRGQSPAITVN